MTASITVTTEIRCNWESDNAGCGEIATLIYDWDSTRDPIGDARRHAASLGWVYDYVHGDRCPGCAPSVTSAMEERAAGRWVRTAPHILDLIR